MPDIFRHGRMLLNDVPPSPDASEEVRSTECATAAGVIVSRGAMVDDALMHGYLEALRKGVILSS